MQSVFSGYRHNLDKSDTIAYARTRICIFISMHVHINTCQSLDKKDGNVYSYMVSHCTIDYMEIQIIIFVPLNATNGCIQKTAKCSGLSSDDKQNQQIIRCQQVSSPFLDYLYVVQLILLLLSIFPLSSPFPFLRLGQTRISLRRKCQLHETTLVHLQLRSSRTGEWKTWKNRYHTYRYFFIINAHYSILYGRISGFIINTSLFLFLWSPQVKH